MAVTAAPVQFGFNRTIKTTPVAKMLPAKNSVRAAGPLKSLEEPQTDMTADEAGFTDYKDLYGNGTHVYWLYLSNAGLDDGDPLHDGQLLRILLVAEETGDETPTIPTGTFECSDSQEAGTFVPRFTQFLDVFPNPEDPDNYDIDNLVAYVYQPTAGEGTVKISKDGDNYLIRVKYEGTLWDESGDEPVVLDTKTCTAVYEGPIVYVEPTIYDPITEDTELNVANLAGGYYDNGDFELTFYSNDMLDDDHFVVNSGQLMNVTILTEDISPMPLNVLTGTLEGFDYTEGLEQNMWMKGFMYEMFTDYYVPMGTALALYDDNGNQDKVGLCVDGTVTFNHLEDGKTDVIFDFVTAEGKKITGSWRGNLRENIIDMSRNAGQEEGVEGITVDADEPEVYTLSGIRVTSDMQPGMYIVRQNGKASKVIVK